MNTQNSIIVFSIIIILSACGHNHKHHEEVKQQASSTLVSLPSGAEPAGGDPIYKCPPCGCASDDKKFTKAGTCPDCSMNLVKAENIKRVAIFVFDGMEILDFAGPGEVFAAARATNGYFQVYTVAAKPDIIQSQGFISIKPKYTIDNCPKPDIIVMPGGGMRETMENKAVLDWVRQASTDWTAGLSVCTGAYVFAEAGILKGKKATTWYGAVDSFQESYPDTEVLKDTRYVDNGSVITTAGVSAGIDGALHLVTKLFGEESAARTAEYMEYDYWKPRQGLVVGASDQSISE